MFLVEYRALLKRLNPVCTRALEAAASHAIRLTHYEIGVEHLLLRLLEEPTGDVVAVYRSLNLSTTPLVRALQRGLEQRKRGNSGRPVFSPLLVAWLQDAWLLGSVEGLAVACALWSFAHGAAATARAIRSCCLCGGP
jgi:type VI secretion system protein VasG